MVRLCSWLTDCLPDILVQWIDQRWETWSCSHTSWTYLTGTGTMRSFVPPTRIWAMPSISSLTCITICYGHASEMWVNAVLIFRGAWELHAWPDLAVVWPSIHRHWLGSCVSLRVGVQRDLTLQHIWTGRIPSVRNISPATTPSLTYPSPSKLHQVCVSGKEMKKNGFLKHQRVNNKHIIRSAATKQHLLSHPAVWSSVPIMS
jgi:hypothetical protein